MFDWQTFLTLAKRLVSETDEASKRSAISRAYYATFQLARQLVELDGHTVPIRGEAHEFVWRRLEEQGKGRRRIGVEGKRLRVSRRKADYDDEITQLDKLAADAVALSETMIALIASESRTSRGSGDAT